MRKRRRDVETGSLSFLDVICCGFGAIILLLVLTKIFEPIRLEESHIELQGLIARYQQELYEIIGETEVVSARALVDDRTVERTRLRSRRSRTSSREYAPSFWRPKTMPTSLRAGRASGRGQAAFDGRDATAACGLSARSERLQGRWHSGRQRIHHLHHRHVGQYAALRMEPRAAADPRDARGLSPGQGYPGLQ